MKSSNGSTLACAAANWKIIALSPLVFPKLTIAWVEACTPRLEGRGEYLVAVDALGAGEGELVMLAQGPSARNTVLTDRRSVDAVVCGIVDLVEERGQVVYRK